jgi:hypothetical protein
MSFLLYLTPRTWSQSINLYPSLKDTSREGWRRINAICAPHADCDLLLPSGAKVRDFTIDISIGEGQLPDSDVKRFARNAIGGLSFGDFMHGYFYLPAKMYSAAWDQIRDGTAHCEIDLSIEPVHYDGADWTTEEIVSITSASLTFRRKPPPADQKAQTKRWFSG